MLEKAVTHMRLVYRLREKVLATERALAENIEKQRGCRVEVRVDAKHALAATSPGGVKRPAAERGVVPERERPAKRVRKRARRRARREPGVVSELLKWWRG